MISCEFPHKRVAEVDLFAIPMDPIESCQLVVFSEAGPVPYCGIDNRRALAAAESLLHRFMSARVVSGGEIVPGDDYLDPRWRVPQLVLAGALANREERFCVAQWCKNELMSTSGQTSGDCPTARSGR